MLLAMGLCSRQSLGDPGRYRFLQTVTSPPQDFLKREREKRKKKKKKKKTWRKMHTNSEMLTGHFWSYSTG